MNPIRATVFMAHYQGTPPMNVMYGSDVPIELTVTDLPQFPANSAAAAYAKGFDTETVYINQRPVSVSGNKITFTPDHGFFVPGDNVLIVKVRPGGETGDGYTFPLTVNCKPNPAWGKLPANPVDIKGYAEAAKASEEQSAAVLAEIKANYPMVTTLSNEVKTLKEDLTYITDNKDVNVCYVTDGVDNEYNGITVKAIDAEHFSISGTSTKGQNILIFNGANGSAGNTGAPSYKSLKAGVYRIFTDNTTDAYFVYGARFDARTSVRNGDVIRLDSDGFLAIHCNNGTVIADGAESVVISVALYEGEHADVTAFDRVARGTIARIDTRSAVGLYGVKYMAHQGTTVFAPENSIPAYKYACKNGYYGINIAVVRPSADGTLWVMHDPSVDRTTDGVGNVSDLTDLQLSAMHIDKVEPYAKYSISDFTPDELLIPTLEKIVKIGLMYGKMIMIRVPIGFTLGQVAMDNLTSIVAKYNLESRMIISCDSLSELETLDVAFPKAIKCVYNSNWTASKIVTQANDHNWSDKSKVALMIKYSEMSADGAIFEIHNNGYLAYCANPGDTSDKASAIEKFMYLAENGCDYVNSEQTVAWDII